MLNLSTAADAALKMPITISISAPLRVRLHVTGDARIIIQMLAGWTFIFSKDFRHLSRLPRIEDKEEIITLHHISLWFCLYQHTRKNALLQCRFVLSECYSRSFSSPPMMHFAYLCLYASQPPLRSSRPRRAEKRRAQDAFKGKTYLTITHIMNYCWN